MNEDVLNYVVSKKKNKQNWLDFVESTRSHLLL